MTTNLTLRIAFISLLFRNYTRSFFYIFLLTTFQFLSAQDLQRPVILVKPADRTSILEKIEYQPWAKKTYLDFIKKLDLDTELHRLNPEKFLRGLPFDWENGKKGEMPPFFLTYHIEDGVHKNLDNATPEEWANGKEIVRYLELGVDCGIAYYITEKEEYAQCAIDILNAFVHSVLQSKLSDWKGRGGWLFPDDGFREVREIGVLVPLIYDFIAEFVKKGGAPFDLIENRKNNFPQEKTQQVIRTYADLTVHYGHTGSNHSVLEAPSLVYNALAIEDATEREMWLNYFLTENTAHQDALNTMVKNFKNEGDIWPETSQYLNGVATIITRLMLIVNKYNPSLHLGEKYANVLFALPALDYIVYPNGEIIRWGDGKRHGNPSYVSYEDAYILGQMDGVEKITNKFGPLLKTAWQEGKYKRNKIENVLLHGVELPNTGQSFILPRTDKVDHAGIFLQRNLSSNNRAEDGLMCFVGGGHMVHGHAEGMNIELYGKGQVLGVDNGRGSYQKDIHENYSRIFAAHNTVIVNGSSQSEGGWVNLGINRVQLKNMEPRPGQEAISPYYSFVQTSFEDDKGEGAEATQQRTLGLIRTSETTGYYVDVFRSKSKLPQEYHDYLYHNIGDELVFFNEDLSLKYDPDRYMANAHATWEQNNKYRHPGWHFFENVKSSGPYSGDVKAMFLTEGLKNSRIYMGLHIPGFSGREYTKVMAPKTFEAPKPYDGLPTPTLVIRKAGESWKEPFVVLYEPFDGNRNNAHIVSVEKLEQQGVYKGLKIVSKNEGSNLIQYVITHSQEDIYKDRKLGIYFKGSYAIITLDEKERLRDMYIGEGKEIKFRGVKLRARSPNNAVYKNYSK